MIELYQRDWEYLQQHGSFAGLDEAGRGALAGPVVIAAVVLDYNKPIEGLNDSKLLKPTTRALLFEQIISSTIAYHIVEMSNRFIDKHNILYTTIRGFYKAFTGLIPPAAHCLIDGPYIPYELTGQALGVIKGDQLYAAIAAASVLAKVHRDRLMVAYDDLYPEYGFAIHKGYATKHHCQMIHAFGPCPIHRCSFHVPG